MFPSPISYKKVCCFLHLRKLQEHEKTTIEICKVRLPVLINPASCFSHRNAVRFLPENLWFKPALWSCFTFWYSWKTVLIQLTVFSMAVHAGFIPTSLYSELASACSGKRWCFCTFSERFIGCVYDNHVVICWESTVGTKIGKPTISLDEPILDRRDSFKK